ncbi:MAG: AraC family transcriptional regulator [Planctomycetes bacterium]|nr:AraC family transcriptional regulator [Planctomycetota bacterium]
MALPLPRSRTVSRPPGAAVHPAFRAISEVVAERASGWDEHRHAEHEAIVVVRGIYRCTLNGVELALRPGQVVVAKPGDRHADHLAAGTAYFAVWFSLAGGLFADGVAAERQVADTGPDAMTAVQRMHRQVCDGVAGARLDAELAALLWLCAGALPAGSLAPAFAPGSDGFAARLHAAFAALPPGRLPVAQLAARLGLSPRTFERRCRAELGCGPARAHSGWRLDRAAELLRSTDRPVRAVSDDLGFANPFHFSRAFARRFGAAPAVWRERIGSGRI